MALFLCDSPEGTTIELLVQEGHVPLKDGGVAIMYNHFNSWTRFICKAGKNEFQEFDFESVKWVTVTCTQLSGRNTDCQSWYQKALL